MITPIKAETLSHIKKKVLSLLSLLHIKWTDTKITRIFLGAIAGYSMIGARTLAGGLLPATVSSFAAATPFVALSLALLWYSTSLVDYENPETLKTVQSLAQKFPLPEIVKKHGWKNMFSFGILDPKTFATKYRAQAETLSFQGILTLYKQAKNELHCIEAAPSYQIPSPSEWKHKFFQETKNFSVEKIIGDYPLSDLESFEILTGEQIGILKKVAETVSREQKATHLANDSCEKNLGKEFDDLLALHRTQYQTVKEEAKTALELFQKSYQESTSSRPKRA